ncbi:LytR/AlgR family response regulator transcription factor [Defluviitalea phaphyphila]|uniref:LytR/AlgR family response regulator transcription factor n=1 Tax=Defluviitalea phaphyphila TaxID=1473580 RepID=UPI00072FD564|nr:LytTR family DNA-binding domain-containing protein [Defluviitalea phaphyphila]
MKPKILICDDNILERKNLIDFLNELKFPLDIYESANNKKILNIAQNQKLDIIITDIIMEKVNSMEIIKKIQEINPYIYIIFVTAYKDYIMQAVTEFHCYDYILKPVNKEHFQNTINLIIKKLKKENDNLIKEKPKKLIIHYNNQSFIIPIDTILFIEQQKYLSIIHTTNGIYKCVSTLVNLYNELNEDFFLSHKSFLVNMQNISHVSYNRKSSGDIFFYNYDKSALLSTRKKSELRKLLTKYKLK